MYKTSRYLDVSNSLQPLALLSYPQGIPTSFNSNFVHKLSKIMRTFFSEYFCNILHKQCALPRTVSSFTSFRPSALASSPWILFTSKSRDTFAVATTSNSCSSLTCLSTSYISFGLPTPPGPYTPITQILSSVIALITTSMIEALDSGTSSFLSTDLAAKVVVVTVPLGVFS
ncbi:hypothetical protein EUGRSUZ_L00086 [Eucalyptus grandis]|uniref:Uncharacterized protein n=1 Tax=Eucalyptus grandis TaxID=71139 RepID=A0A058ZW55_EUCGR|nr:hypothetical protein EUGRSUZ_L00086 [Eucalyptus grandis]